MLVGGHDAAQLAELREQQPQAVVEVAEDVHRRQHRRRVQRVDVELRRVPVTLKNNNEIF